MKQYVKEKNICNYHREEQTYYMFIKVLIVMALYRIIKEGIFPFIQEKISILELCLPILLIFGCVLLCYGGYYIGQHFLGYNQYKEEECLVDSLLLGLLLPVKTPVWLLFLAVFLTIFIGRYFYEGSPIGTPTIIGILGVISFLIWLQICHLESTITKTLLLEFTESYQLNQLSIIDVWFGNIGEWFSKTSPILCILGFLYLRKNIKWKIPVYFIGTCFILFIISNYFVSNKWADIIKWFGSGNVLFLTLFCATETRTTPVTDVGQILFAVFLGIFTYIGNFFFTPFLALVLSIIISNFLIHFYDYFGNYYELKYCSEYKNI